MSSNDQHATGNTHTVADKLILWLFVVGVVLCVGLGTWALFFKV